MFNFFKSFRNYVNAFSGKGLGSKFVVFESDDWGSLRIPSLNVYNDLKASGLGDNPFNRFDTLESSNDLNALFTTLSNFKDHKGNPPVFTLDFVVGNPDFERIKQNRFQQYYWESSARTYERYQNSNESIALLKEGIAKKFVYPQFHGREHINATYWLELLKNNHPQLLKAFDCEVFCIDVQDGLNKRNNLMASFDYWNNDSKLFIGKHITEGLSEFEKLFGFSSKSFMAPCNVWDEYVEQQMSSHGVRFIQTLNKQKVPLPDGKPYYKKMNRMGDKNEHGQLYTVRNVYFEPSTNTNYDWMGNAMDKIEAAFFWGKPAIISSHRINYVGGLSEQNRLKGLENLTLLLKNILKRWPEVEFISSEQLGELYNN